LISCASNQELQGIREHVQRRYDERMSTSAILLPLDTLGRHRLKVAFVGTHGVGKTTLCFDLAAQLKRLDLGVDIVKEVARRCPLPINEETTLDAQAWILHTQIAEEIEASSQYEVVVCDRSALDNYAYLVARSGKQPQLEPLVRQWVQGYQALFKVPVTGLPAFDGKRAVSPTFQQQIDQIIDELVQQFGVAVHHLDPHDRAGWTVAALQYLGLPTQPPQIDLFSSRE